MEGLSTPRLRQLREEIDVTREEMVRFAPRLSLSTIRNAERGCKVRRRSALRILEAINGVLKQRQMPEVSIEDLGLTL